MVFPTMIFNTSYDSPGLAICGFKKAKYGTAYKFAEFFFSHKRPRHCDKCLKIFNDLTNDELVFAGDFIEYALVNGYLTTGQ